MKLKNSRPEMSLIIVPLTVTAPVNAAASGTSYLIGAFIAVLILGYLLYSLLKPDKF